MIADWMTKYACASQEILVFNSPVHGDFLFILVDDNIYRTFEKKAV